MKKVLYVNGCSHSAGAELEYVFSYRTQYDIDNSWGGVIANKYNLVHRNDAAPGGSNKIIYSTTVHSVLKLLEDYDPSEIFVIIGWTGFDRTEVIYDNVLYHFAPGMADNPWYKEWPGCVKDAFKSWVLTVDTHSDSVNTFSLYYFSLVNFLKQYKIKYFFFNALHPVYKPKTNALHKIVNNEWNQHLFTCMETDSNYLEPNNQDMTYFNYLKKRYNPQVDGRNYHFQEDAQQEWANILIKHIDKYLTE